MQEEIKKAKELINSESFKEAEQILLKLRDKKHTSEIGYLLGYIHHINIPTPFSGDEKFKGTVSAVKQFLGEAIDLEPPVEDAFWRLSDVEGNKKHSVRILKKGLESFPNSVSIYESLIQHSENSGISDIYKAIKEKNINSNNICYRLYNFFFGQKNYAEAIKLLKKIKTESNAEQQLLNLKIAFCFLESHDSKNTEQAKIIFQKLINDDINHKLDYAQYVGLLLCFLEKNEIEHIRDLIKEFPYKFSELFAIIPDVGGFGFEKYFFDAIRKSLLLFKNKKEYKETYSKLIGIKALKELEKDTVKTSVIAELKMAKRNLSEKKIFDEALPNAYLRTGFITEAFEQDLNNIMAYYPDYTSEVWIILYEISKGDLKEIIPLFLTKLEGISSRRKVLFKDVVENIVPLIFKDKNYNDVIKICDLFSEETLEQADVLFELAYSFNEKGDDTKAKKFYENIWRKNETNGAVANNLALLYEKEGDKKRAKTLLEKALEIYPDDNTAKKNLLRVSKNLDDEVKNVQKTTKEQEKALETIKTENLYIYDKIHSLVCSEDDSRYIVASYGQLSNILRANSEKVHELISGFIQKRYIVKVQNHNIDTLSNVYQVNPLVRDFVLKNRERIEENKPFSIIGEKINIDSFEALGFKKDLLQKIDSKISDNELREILKRDLKENAFALLTQSYKTSLVLSGSIIEAVVLNKVRTNEIERHLPGANAQKDKKVIDMDLSELLFVAEANKIINVQLYHFSQALRFYRNFIHPAVEVRNSAITKISKDDADIAWGITKKIIIEI
ncbi:MAG: tetratricopeptide repeat protein [Candidatus Paceibacterota bacterium]|jgi:tetratricopeptide (TPR) repeat protein